MKNSNPVVSICCLAYNMEKYIGDTIEGFLLQKVSFPIEIIIHDDCSTDNTANIIREYVDKYPELIKPIFQKKNQYSLGKQMFPITFAHAKGQYIACCEGDDYWTDPNKLQRQTDFLETHLEYVMVTENSIDDDLIKETRRKFSKLPERDIDILELLGERAFATASVFFRNLGEKIMPGGDSTTVDTIMWCHLSKLGKIRYLENVSSVYRRHPGGETRGDLMEWTKKTVGYNNTLRHNHPEVDSFVFKERNINQFKYHIGPLILDSSYKQALLTADELINLTHEPSEYREEMYQYVEELLVKKDNSWSFKIGRVVTMPVKIMLKLKNNLFKSIGKLSQKYG
jgi:glycosyltransferase involved in cell wall biosynthesis